MTQPLRSVRVSGIVQLAPDIRMLTLVPPEGEALPGYAAGAHIDVQTPSGLLRQYSLCTAHHDGSSYRIAVKLVENSRGGSRAMHQLSVGDALMIGEPRNHFPLHEARHHVLIAGGIGITPVFAMMQHLQAHGESYELHYFARGEAFVCFRNEMRQPELASNVHWHLGLDPQAVSAALDEILALRPTGHHVYFCGPGALMECIEACALARGWAQDTLHKEYFSPAEQGDSPPAAEFTVKLNSSRQTFNVPADKSILQVLRENGLSPLSSCEQGTCGTCICKVLEGTPDHRDHFLSDFHKKSGKKIAICVSRSSSESLTLDL